MPSATHSRGRERSTRTQRRGAFIGRGSRAACPIVAPGYEDGLRGRERTGRAVEVTGDGAGDRCARRGDRLATDAAAFDHEGGVRDAPAVVEFPDEVIVGNARFVDEDLVEQRTPRHLTEGANFDAGLAHREHEVGQASVLGQVRVGSGDEDPVIGPLPE